MSLHYLLSYATIATVDGVMLFYLVKIRLEMFFCWLFFLRRRKKASKEGLLFVCDVRKIERPLSTRGAGNGGKDASSIGLHMTTTKKKLKRRILLCFWDQCCQIRRTRNHLTILRNGHIWHFLHKTPIEWKNVQFVKCLPMRGSNLQKID